MIDEPKFPPSRVERESVMDILPKFALPMAVLIVVMLVLR